MYHTHRPYRSIEGPYIQQHKPNKPCLTFTSPERKKGKNDKHCCISPRRALRLKTKNCVARPPPQKPSNGDRMAVNKGTIGWWGRFHLHIHIYVNIRMITYATCVYRYTYVSTFTYVYIYIHICVCIYTLYISRICCGSRNLRMKSHGTAGRLPGLP